MENSTLNFDNYLFRCSSLGKLMVGVKPSLTPNQETEMLRLLENQKVGKITEKQTITLGQLLEKKHAPETLSTTTQNYLKEIHKEILFKRSNELRSKYLDKGIQVEEKSLTLYSNVSENLLLKNKQRFNNKYFTGEPDNIKNIIRDIKSSWDYSTFPFYDDKITNSDYEFQLLGYMNLTGLKKAELIYCLVDTPDKIINDELRRLDWKENIMDNEGNIRLNSIPLVVELIQSKIYTSKGLEMYCESNPAIKLEWFDNFREVPEFLRVKVFKLEYDEFKVKKLYSQIEKSREFLNELSLKVAERMEVVT